MGFLGWNGISGKAGIAGAPEEPLPREPPRNGAGIPTGEWGKFPKIPQIREFHLGKGTFSPIPILG